MAIPAEIYKMSNHTEPALPKSSSTNNHQNAYLQEEFQRLFPSVPTHEQLVESYVCSLSRSGLLRVGTLYVTSARLCFTSKFITLDINVPWHQVQSITKRARGKLLFDSIVVSYTRPVSPIKTAPSAARHSGSMRSYTPPCGGSRRNVEFDSVASESGNSDAIRSANESQFSRGPVGATQTPPPSNKTTSASSGRFFSDMFYGHKDDSPNMSISSEGNKKNEEKESKYVCTGFCQRQRRSISHNDIAQNSGCRWSSSWISPATEPYSQEKCEL